jgi:hypothetical protein
MRRDLRAALAAAILAFLLALPVGLGLLNDASAQPDGDPTGTPSPSSTPSSTPSESPSGSPTPSDVPDGAFEVDDAVLRWGINNESNNRAFAPGTYNFFSAGKIPDPGKGGQLVARAGWRQRSGDVAIEKYSTAAGAYVPATWDGLRTGSDNQAITSPTSGRFSNHQVVLSGGSGEVDPDAGEARIAWTGSFTVVYYSGYSFYYVTDPVLTVRDDVAVLTARLSGFASSMDDMTQWEPVAPRKVTLANLGNVELGGELGFTATPKYLGVKASVPDTVAAQVRSGDSWGSFPQSFIDFQLIAGAASYWYSSGGSTDAFKPTLPLTVSYRAGSPVAPPTPTTSTTNDPVINPVVTPPPTISAPTPSTPPVDPGVAPTAAPPPVDVPEAPVVPVTPAAVDAPALALAASQPQQTVFPATTPVAASEDRSATWAWWLGAGAMAAAAGVLVRALAPRRRT